MADLTPDQRIDADRKAKWVAFRRKHGMAEDAPFVGKCPWVECYEEALDALNYLEQIKPEWWTIADYVDAQLHARVLAAICLKHMKGGTEWLTRT
jgi:hypothetical protein